MNKILKKGGKPQFLATQAGMFIFIWSLFLTVGTPLTVMLLLVVIAFSLTGIVFAALVKKGNL